MQKEVTLERDCPATVIPAGDPVILQAGDPVLITQALGGSVTVRNSSGLFRIERDNLNALGDDIAAELVEISKEEKKDDNQTFSEELVWEALRTCYDPEIPVNIVDLGLIYDMQSTPVENDEHAVSIKMTLTAQGCGMGPTIARDAQTKVEALNGVKTANVEIVWDPQWTPHMISPKGRELLGLE